MLRAGCTRAGPKLRLGFFTKLLDQQKRSLAFSPAAVLISQSTQRAHPPRIATMVPWQRGHCDPYARRRTLPSDCRPTGRTSNPVKLSSRYVSYTQDGIMEAPHALTLPSPFENCRAHVVSALRRGPRAGTKTSVGFLPRCPISKNESGRDAPHPCRSVNVLRTLLPLAPRP